MPQATSSFDVYASAVGVVVQSTPVAVTTDRLITASNVGVMVGTGIISMSPSKPDGILKGSSGSLIFNGIGLNQVTSTRLIGSSTATISLGSVTVNAAGTQLSLPVFVNASVASGTYGVGLYTGSGTATVKVSSIGFDSSEFRVGSLPSLMESVTPIVLEQGKTYTFTVRGDGLQDVYQLVADLASGINFGYDLSSVQWSTDALGEKLTVRVFISNDAPIGSRVIRLRVPGGITDGAPLPANTITIVAPL